jgi:hypothetical protein
MQEKDDERQESKQPIDMTSDELLDYAIAPQVVERVRQIAKREAPDRDPESED